MVAYLIRTLRLCTGTPYGWAVIPSTGKIRHESMHAPPFYQQKCGAISLLRLQNVMENFVIGIGKEAVRLELHLDRFMYDSFVTGGVNSPAD